jgi:hypothetical protein
MSATLILVGVLGAANLIIARKPEAKQIINKIAPYQGWIGVGSVFWGLWGLTWSLLDIPMIAWAPIFWITELVASLLMVALGVLLGIGVFKMFIKKPEAVEKLELLVTKLAPKQGILGFAAIGTGFWLIVASLFFAASAVDDLDDWAEVAANNQQALIEAQLAAQQAALAQQGATAQQLAAAQAAAAAAAAQQMGQVPVAPPAVPAAPPAPVAAGTPAKAMVQQTWAAGVDPATQQPLLGMDLYVTPTAGAPYNVRIPSFPVPAAKQAMLAPNAWIQVTVDPTNPQNVTPVL